MGSSLLAAVYHPLVCLTVALATVLLVRQPLCRAFGPRVAYTIWGLVPLVALGALIPAPAHLPSGIPVQVAILHVPQPVAILHIPHPGGVIGHGHLDPSRWVIVCWMIGAGLLAWVQWYQQRAFVRRLGLVRHDDTGEWVSDASEIGPVVVGVFPPKIVLPFDFRHRYTLQEQTLVLAHERMHLIRYDPFANFGVAVVRSLLWFHPLVHLANRAFRIDQELACDAAVLEACPQDRHRYATALLKTQIDGQELAAGAAGCCLAVQTTSSFKRRILMLRTPAPRAWRRLLGTTVIVASCLVSSGFAWTSHALPLPVTTGLFRVRPQIRFRGMADSDSGISMVVDGVPMTLDSGSGPYGIPTNKQHPKIDPSKKEFQFYVYQGPEASKHFKKEVPYGAFVISDKKYPKGDMIFYLEKPNCTIFLSITNGAESGHNKGIDRVLPTTIRCS